LLLIVSQEHGTCGEEGGICGWKLEHCYVPLLAKAVSLTLTGKQQKQKEKKNVKPTFAEQMLMKVGNTF
jgi:hypothetical protein